MYRAHVMYVNGVNASHVCDTLRDAFDTLVEMAECEEASQVRFEKIASAKVSEESAPFLGVGVEAKLIVGNAGNNGGGDGPIKAV